MAFSTRARLHLRANWVGYLALFCFATMGTANALPGKNKVDSGDIKKAQVKRGDLAPNSVNSSKVADNALTGGDLAPNSVNSAKVADNALTGVDIDEATLSVSGPPSGPAGGDLTGSYPSPLIAPDAVNSAKVADGTLDASDFADTNSLTGAEIDESGLVPGGDLTGSLASAQVADNSIGSIEALAGDNDPIVDGTVESQDVTNGSIRDIDVTSEIASGSQVVADGAVGVSPPYQPIVAAQFLGIGDSEDVNAGIEVGRPMDNQVRICNETAFPRRVATNVNNGADSLTQLATSGATRCVTRTGIDVGETVRALTTLGMIEAIRADDGLYVYGVGRP